MTGSDADVVAFDLWAPEREVFAAVRIDRGSASAVVAVSGDVTAHGDATAEIGDSHVQLAAAGTRIECKLRPLSPTVDESAPATATVARAAGLHRQVQLYEVDGTLSAGGNATKLHATGVRVQARGETADGRRRRFVTAATADGRLVTVMAVAPSTTTPHGEELVAGYVVDPGSDGAAPYEEVRLSTIFGSDGQPRKAGAELYRPGDELPARLSGEAVLGAVLGPASISFFRWTLTGQAGWGTYELEPAP
jgi:hypothetical protein